MSDTGQEVIDRLAGRKSQVKRDNQLRRTVWYSRWNSFADFLDTNPSKRAILQEIDRLIDQARGYGHAFKAGASFEAVNLVIRERR